MDQINYSERRRAGLNEKSDRIACMLRPRRLSGRCIHTNTSPELGDDYVEPFVLAGLSRCPPRHGCKEQRDNNSHPSIHQEKDRKIEAAQFGLNADRSCDLPQSRPAPIKSASVEDDRRALSPLLRWRIRRQCRSNNRRIWPGEIADESFILPRQFVQSKRG